MRIGTTEIIIIVIVIIALVIITRVIRLKDSSNQKHSRKSQDNNNQPERQQKTKFQAYVKRTGIVSIIASILLALSIVSIFKWAIQSYFWALILLVLGFGLLYISRKK